MKVLILGRQQNVMEKILPVVKNEGFEVIGVLTDDEAVEHLWFGQFDIVAVGGGVERDSRERIRLAAIETETKMLEIFGPDSLMPKLLELKK